MTVRVVVVFVGAFIALSIVWLVLQTVGGHGS
jgi:hypothetical protein